MDEEQNALLTSGEEQNEETLTEEQLRELFLEARTREIREVLLGNLVQGEDLRLSVREDRFVTPWGIEDGATETLLFGIMCRTYYYETTLKNNAQALFRVGKAMQDVGRGLNLVTAPNMAACMVKSLLFRPVVLVFEEMEDEDGKPALMLHAYCSRTLTSLIPIARAVSRLEKYLPEQVYRKGTQPASKSDKKETTALRSKK